MYNTSKTASGDLGMTLKSNFHILEKSQIQNK